MILMIKKVGVDMRKTIIFIFFFFLIGCNQSFEQTTPTVVITNTLSPTPSFVSTETLTPIPTQTLAILFTPTSNFNNLKPQVVTPSLPETCPDIKDNIIVLPDNPKEYFLGMNKP